MLKNYDIAVIGGGAGGLVVASVCAQMGLSVALINKEEAMGGDCLHYGCVPSKTLLKSAGVAHTINHAKNWGVKATKPSVDIAKINQRIQQAVAALQVHDSRERFESLGCDVITGQAKFISEKQIQVKNKMIKAKQMVIATGSYPWAPPIKGLAQVKYFTNESMFSLRKLPKSLIILGGGPIGVEMAQAYARLGSQVTLVEMAKQLLPRMDKDLSTKLAQVLKAEGVNLLLDAQVVEVAEEKTKQTERKKIIHLKNGEPIEAEELLVAIGRRAEVESLNLTVAKIDYDVHGIKVNAKMQTSNKKIYACGDVTGAIALTHVAELQAGIVIANMLFKIPKKIHYNVIPTVVYSSPEIASVGLSVEQGRKLKRFEVHQFDVSGLDRAVTDNETVGLAKIMTHKGRIVGAHILAPHAGELIHEMALAIQEKMKVSKITALVHAYPSYSQLNKRLAGQYYQQRFFNQWTKKLVYFLNRYFS